MKNTHFTLSRTTATKQRSSIQQFLNQLKFPLVAVLSLLFIIACSKDDEDDDTPKPGDITITATTPEADAIDVLRSTTVTAHLVKQ